MKFNILKQLDFGLIIIIFLILIIYGTPFVSTYYHSSKIIVSSKEEISDFILGNECHTHELKRMAVNSKIITNVGIEHVKKRCLHTNNKASPLLHQSEALGVDISNELPYQHTKHK